MNFALSNPSEICSGWNNSKINRCGLKHRIQSYTTYITQRLQNVHFKSISLLWPKRLFVLDYQSLNDTFQMTEGKGMKSSQRDHG